MSIPFTSYRFWITVFIFFIVWSLLHGYALYLFNYTWEQCLIDSLLSNSLLLLGCFFISNSLTFYLPDKSRFDILIFWCLGMSALVVFISIKLLIYVNNNKLEYTHELIHTVPIRMGITFLVICCSGMISVIWFKQIEQNKLNSRQREAENIVREAELFKLHQQLQPHFLFNSLNSISALINANPIEARKMIHQLSDFLRGTLKMEREMSTLDEELKHLSLYLAIEKVRFGNRLITDISNSEEISSILIPNMILQPIVENAIKFGLYGITGSVTIQILVANQKSFLDIKVKNPFDAEGAPAQSGAGFGLGGIKRRLYLLYGRNDLLETFTDGALFTTNLKIPHPALYA